MADKTRCRTDYKKLILALDQSSSEIGFCLGYYHPNIGPESLCAFTIDEVSIEGIRAGMDLISQQLNRLEKGEKVIDCFVREAGYFTAASPNAGFVIEQIGGWVELAAIDMLPIRNRYFLKVKAAEWRKSAWNKNGFMRRELAKVETIRFATRWGMISPTEHEADALGILVWAGKKLFSLKKPTRSAKNRPDLAPIEIGQEYLSEVRF
ncbi:hypothetical protein KAR91_32750 [Candidatus Pacearchaeota archaeon]|nr:hypothetical protein [Candidatus Pacearchaeota archaeon]